jgi:hypothetical protein
MMRPASHRTCSDDRTNQHKPGNPANSGGLSGHATTAGRSASIRTMVDQLAITIATNVATKITDTLTSQAQQAVAAIVEKIRERLRSRAGESGEVATLDAAITASDAPAEEAHARVLERLFIADPRFGRKSGHSGIPLIRMRA